MRGQQASLEGAEPAVRVVQQVYGLADRVHHCGHVFGFAQERIAAGITAARPRRSMVYTVNLRSSSGSASRQVVL